MRFFVLVVALTGFFGPGALAGGPLGVGIILGSPTGISANFELEDNRSVDGALAFSSGSQKFYLHSSYLVHYPDTIAADNYLFGWFYGLGARIETVDKNKEGEQKTETEIGPRGSLGFYFPFAKDLKFDLFAEISLGLTILPGTSANTGVGVGGRVYF